MILKQAEKKLKKGIQRKFIFYKDKQDKYFLKGEIENLFPELDDDLVNKAIDRCSQLLKYPSQRDDFIRVFLDQLFLILEEETLT